MKEKINIAAILKDKPNGIRLYSPIFGDCTYCYVREDTNDICVKKHNGEKAFFNSKGLYNILGECLLFQSKEMLDWRKFAWKKGDVLISNDYGTEVIFYDWYDDTYTNFYGKHRLDSEDKNNIKYNDAFLCTTGRYSLEDKDAAQTYINTIEERLGGKLNREILEIEKQPEFKDGDIVALDTRYIDSDDVIVEYFIVRGDYKYGDDIKYYAGCSNNTETDVVYNSSIMINKTSVRKESLRLATEAEKKQFFSALANKGKAWDSDMKQIVDLKPNVELKPFDKVLSRRCSKDYWVLNFYSHKTDYYHICIDGSSNLYCIPYNEETAHLLGTTDEWKGGEG